MRTNLAGTNPAMVRILFDRKMKRAYELEPQLEATHFEHDDELCHIIMSGRPTLIQLDIKSDCTPNHLVQAINSVLEKVHIYREQMAKELIGGE